MYWYERIARMLTSPKHWTKVECSQRQHIELLFRWIRWTELPSKNQILLVFRFIVENPHLLKRSYPNHSICPVREKKIFLQEYVTYVKKKSDSWLNHFASDIYKPWQIKGGFYAFSHPAWFKAAIFCKDNRGKNTLYTAYINYNFSLPIMFSAGLCIITAKCNETEKGKKNGLLGNFPILEMQC